jgi:hypothetical protein
MQPTIVKLPFVVGPPPADWKPTTESKKASGELMSHHRWYYLSWNSC